MTIFQSAAISAGAAALAVVTLSFFAWSEARADRKERAAIVREVKEAGAVLCRAARAEDRLAAEARFAAATAAHDRALKQVREAHVAELDALRAKARRLARRDSDALSAGIVGLRNDARTARNAARPALRDGPAGPVPGAVAADR